MYDKETLQRKRQLVRRLYFDQHLNKSEIARKLSVTWNFVHKWTKDPKVKITDHRGWPKGKRRTHTKKEEERLIEIRSDLEEQDFFFGAGKIIDEYKRKYPDEPKLNKSYVNRVISQHFPMSKRKSLKAVKEQNYPIEAIASLGNIQEEADFLGKKYIHGQSDPIHFFTRVYKKPFTLRLIHRVPDQGTETILDTFTRDWKTFPLPNVLSIDNGFGFTAAGSGKRYISSFIQYLLKLGITPLFIAPKKPWMNGAVEGTHSVFARKVWNKYQFSNLNEIDRTVARFQEAYRLYAKTPDFLPGKSLDASFSWKDVIREPFHPEEGMNIYLIRLVENRIQDDREHAAIALFKDIIELDKVYLNQYVLVVLDTYNEKAKIFIEPDGKGLQKISQIDFPIRFAKKKY